MPATGASSCRSTEPHLWSAEDPFRYDLTIEVRDARGTLTEHIPVQMGVRRFGIEDGMLSINGTASSSAGSTATSSGSRAG